jgi:hypothetical protein
LGGGGEAQSRGFLCSPASGIKTVGAFTCQATTQTRKEIGVHCTPCPHPTPHTSRPRVLAHWGKTGYCPGAHCDPANSPALWWWWRQEGLYAPKPRSIAPILENNSKKDLKTQPLVAKVLHCAGLPFFYLQPSLSSSSDGIPCLLICLSCIHLGTPSQLSLVLFLSSLPQLEPTGVTEMLT